MRCTAGVRPGPGRRSFLSPIAAAIVLWLPVGIQAQRADVPLADRARGAERVVVGQVGTVSPIWRTNEFGDRLIVSVAHVTVQETLKGKPEGSVEVEIEGGTIGGLTLHVSDLEPVATGERAVFYLERTARGAFVPHLRGQGFLKLDRDDRVRNSTLRLSDIRRAIGTTR